MAKYDRKVAIAKPENEIDKLRLWYFQQDSPLLAHDQRITLTDGQEAKRKQLQKVWSLLVENSKEKTLQIIEGEYQVSHRQAYNLVRQSQELFGNISVIKKDIDRALRVAKREAIIQLIKEDEDLEAADKYALMDKYLTAIEKMGDHYNAIELSAEEILEQLKLPAVTRSTNPETLDTEAEEVND